MPSILTPIAERSHVGHRHIHILRVEGAVEQGGLTALADACSNPLARIDGAKGLSYGMQVVSTRLGSQVLPILWVGGALVKVAILHKNHIGIQHLR